MHTFTAEDTNAEISLSSPPPQKREIKSYLEKT
jgi:hypothetical protein